MLHALVAAAGNDAAWGAAVLEAAHNRNLVGLDELSRAAADPRVAAALRSVPRIRGGAEAIVACREATAGLGCEAALDDLSATWDLLVAAGVADRVVIDFSVMRSFDYYTGLVVEAFAPGLGLPLGGGGRYDGVLGAYDSPLPAAGFALGLERVMIALVEQGVDVRSRRSTRSSAGIRPPRSRPRRRSGAAGKRVALSSRSGTELATRRCGSARSKSSTPAVSARDHRSAPTRRPLRIAIPKGALFADSVDVLTRAGLDTTGLAEPGRQLIVRTPTVEYIIGRTTDIPIYAAYGGADCAIAGKDVLLEAGLDCVELVDLRFGGCRFVVAEPDGATGEVRERARHLGVVRVATKYPNISSAYFEREGIAVEMVKLHGNIELAPLIGLADWIVDITATGTTLAQNNLRIVGEVLSSTARFVGNPAAVRTDPRVLELADTLAALSLESQEAATQAAPTRKDPIQP